MNLSLFYGEFKTFLRFLSVGLCLEGKIYCYIVKILYSWFFFLWRSIFFVNFLVSVFRWKLGEVLIFKGLAQIVGAATLEPDPAGWAIFVIVIFWGIIDIFGNFGANPRRLEPKGGTPKSWNTGNEHFLEYLYEKKCVVCSVFWWFEI